MPVLARALCLAAIAAAAPAQTVNNPATLQAAPRISPAQTTTKPALPPGAAARDARLRAQTPADRLQWADRTAGQQLSPDAIRAAVVNSWPELAPASIEDLVFIVMMAAARDADADLRADMTAMRDTNAEKQAQRDQQQRQGGQLDAMGELSEMDSLRLQMVMDRRAKLMAALSNMMKKASDTQDNIIRNIK